MRAIGIAIVLAACGGGAGGGDAGDDAPDAATGDPTLSDQYPGDVGLGGDPAVVWFEDFEAGTVAAVTARYDQAQGAARMALVAGPAGEAMAMTAGQGVDAVDLYAQLPDHDELWVRWYARYDAGVPWHHSGVWFGGYAPAMPYPSPMAGLRPDGDDRFSVSIEPVWDIGGAAPRFDTYNYWMAMHSWMETPTDDGTSYYGNALIHQNGFTIDEDQWVCLEVHVRLNPDPASGAGAVLEVWKGDVPVIRYDDAGPMGYWIRDKFCPTGADGSECTDYPAPFDQVLDLRYRSDAALRLNAFWPQNYITEPAMGTLTFDQMVVATTRVGCLR
jgi:hypothetical protein